MHAAELQKRYGDEGLVAVSVHPGVIKTELHRNKTGAQIFYALGSLFMKSIPQGAATQTLCLVREDLVGGGYYADCQLETPSQEIDGDVATGLWELSERLVASQMQK
jgi:hypothetical protein